MSDNTPGWQPDPSGKHDHRYWDGSQWTDNVSDGGVAGTDPYVPDATVADAPTPDDAPTAVDTPAAGDTGWAQPAPPTTPDATAAWPAATTAGAAGAAPPPYTPPSPVSGDDGSGGSKRGLLIGGGLLAAVAVAAGAFFLLGGDDEDSARVELAARLQEETDGELDDAQAECVAGYFADAIGDDELAEIDFDADEPPQVFLDAFEEIDLDEMADDCELDPETFGTDTGGDDGGTDETDDGATDDTDDGGSTDEPDAYGDDPELDALYDDCEGGDLVACDDLYFDSPVGSEYESFGSTCGDTTDETFGFCEEDDSGSDGSSDGFSDGGELPDNFEEILADTYETSLGLERDKAECLAGKLADVIESGEISEDEAMTEIFGYLSDCDISMEEIGAN
jgi:hypothetical protein